MDQYPSPNHDPRPTGTIIDTLVLHYTGMRSAADAMARMCDAAAQVSAHYMIDESGQVTVLVAEDQRAWHAGEAWWRGQRDINARSVGIELVNTGHEFGLEPFPDAQVSILIDLCRDILSRHSIPALNIVGHSDVAPRRRQDPGELFPWSRLAAADIGFWPEAGKPMWIEPGLVLSMLAEIGYETDDWEKSIGAFQRRYRPAAITGRLDDETVTLIAAVLDSSR